MWKRSKTLKVSKVAVVPDFTASIPAVLATESEDSKHVFTERMAARKQLKKKIPEDKADKKVYDFVDDDEKKELSGSEDDVREGKRR